MKKLNNSKAGISAEHHLIRKLRDSGFIVFHSPASGGGTKQPMPDLYFSKYGYPTFIVELKTCRSGSSIYIAKKQVEDLKKIQKNFSGFTLIVVKFIKLKRGKYIVVHLGDLRETKKAFVIDYDNVKDNLELLEYIETRKSNIGFKMESIAFGDIQK